MPPSAAPQLAGNERAVFIVNHDWHTFVSFDGLILLLLLLAAAVIVLLRYAGPLGLGFRQFEIEEAQFGLGDQTVTLRPNDIDRQIAYKIWVELSTRKIGLEIDLDNDVLIEVYDSWYGFFSVTRELIKDVPVAKFRRKDTEKIIRLSIEVLNTGIRPHLTKWQARFRRWYEMKLDHDDHLDLAPQLVQMKYPEIEALRSDLEVVNQRLIRYREKMHQLVKGT